MNSEQYRLEKILLNYLKDIPINQKTKLRNFTKFDCEVIDTIRELQNRFADEPKPKMTDECKELGFTINDGSLAGCSTIPCFGGKMPYQCEPIVGCAIGRTMCDESPINSVRTIRKFEKVKAKLKETKRLEKNETARALYKARKQRAKGIFE